MRYIYFQDDNTPHLIVRWDEERKVIEQYLPGRGWVEEPEWIGIFAGVYPYFSDISEEEALKIVRELEERGRD